MPILHYITIQDLDIPPGAHGEVRGYCPPQCPRDRRSKDISVSIDKGIGLCHRCGLKFRLGDGPRQPFFPNYPKPAADPTLQRANASDLDNVYRVILARLHLSSDHRRNLRERGLNDTQILRGRYKSLPIQGRAQIACDLIEQFGEALCATVPGFVRKEADGRRWWTLAGAAGLAIPVRDPETRIVGIKIRADDDSRHARYSWISSARYSGTGPGAPVHMPIFTSSGEVVRITEGPLKADVATCLSGVLTLGVAGVAQWRTALPVLERLNPKRLLLSWDQDWRGNMNVARTLRDAALTLDHLGYEIQMEDWPPAYKGIDDAMGSGCAPSLRPLGYLLAQTSTLTPQPQSIKL